MFDLEISFPVYLIFRAYSVLLNAIDSLILQLK